MEIKQKTQTINVPRSNAASRKTKPTEEKAPVSGLVRDAILVGSHDTGSTRSTGRAAGILVGSLRENFGPPPPPRLSDVVDLREAMENRIRINRR